MKTNFQRKDAKTPRCGGVRISLAPGFSQVSGAGVNEKPFQPFLRAGGKPLKRFTRHTVLNTRLKPGANEMSSCAAQGDLCGTTALTPARIQLTMSTLTLIFVLPLLAVIGPAFVLSHWGVGTWAGAIRFLCKGCVVCGVFFMTLNAQSQGSLTLNAGQEYTYEFNALPVEGEWSRALPPGTPAALVTGAFVPGSFPPGSSILFEIFENSLFSLAVASQTLISQADQHPPPGPAFWSLNSWQDLQGAIRVKMLSGSATLYQFNVTAIRYDSGTLNSYGKSVLPVPEPTVTALFIVSAIPVFFRQLTNHQASKSFSKTTCPC